MTEKEKCAACMLYDANYDEALLRERDLCKDICFEYNSTRPSQLHTKKDLLRSLFGKTDGDFTIQAPFWCDYGYNIELGKNFYANHNLVILDGAKVKFGDNVFIAPDCGFHTAGVNRNRYCMLIGKCWFHQSRNKYGCCKAYGRNNQRNCTSYKG